MTPLAIVFLVLAVLILWGGLAVSVTALARRPERDDYPPGGLDDERVDDAPMLRDT